MSLVPCPLGLASLCRCKVLPLFFLSPLGYWGVISPTSLLHAMWMLLYPSIEEGALAKIYEARSMQATRSSPTCSLCSTHPVQSAPFPLGPSSLGSQEITCNSGRQYDAKRFTLIDVLQTKFAISWCAGHQLKGHDACKVQAYT